MPEYAISDNASIMAKGIRLSGIDHHRDISHSLGMYLERTYKEADDFKAYVKQWSCKMLDVYHTLSCQKKTVYRQLSNDSTGM
ncbi:hypothetical protein AGMMS49525_02810 [Bacteroidia bacterium]|nr:hypothetical protein AGMMS49525_02810 [Bacteroidia bacterium]